jgi:hypothetical protein
LKNIDKLIFENDQPKEEKKNNLIRINHTNLFYYTVVNVRIVGIGDAMQERKTERHSQSKTQLYVVYHSLYSWDTLQCTTSGVRISLIYSS